MDIKIIDKIKNQISNAEFILIGVGEELDTFKKVLEEEKVTEVYQHLYELVKGKNYFIVSTNTDGLIYDSEFSKESIVTPCGNRNQLQCSKACTKTIWEKGAQEEELLCPICGSLAVSHTVEEEHYIEEGYLPQWGIYTNWLQTTMNRKLCILEFGVGFSFPTVIRWPFEKIGFINQKACLIRVHSKFPQLSEELSGKGISCKSDSLEVIRQLYTAW